MSAVKYPIYAMDCDACNCTATDWWYKCLTCPFAICKLCFDRLPESDGYQHPVSHSLQRVLDDNLSQQVLSIYSCPWCPILSIEIQGLYDHIIDEHPAPRNPRTVFCPVCLMIPCWRFQKSSDLTEHFRMQHDCFTKPKAPLKRKIPSASD